MTHIAIDLGAGSGRVILGAGEHFEILHRFPNTIVTRDGHERWDIRALFAGIDEGLARAARSGHEILSIGADTWGVDYGLLDANGVLLEDPICYRDARTNGVPEQVRTLVPDDELFRRTGVQVQAFNTLYQLFAHVRGGRFPKGARRLCFMPDLVHAHLCDSQQSELTIASTSQMLDVHTREWDRALLERLGIPTTILPELVPPGTRLGTLTPALQEATGLPAIPVVAPAAHDTASAVVIAAPRVGDAFLSSGTWSLLGVLTDAPITSDTARAGNLTNEAGAFGNNRLLANVMGLWILEECRRVWCGRGLDVEWEPLLACAAAARPNAGRIAVDDPRYFHPADMVAELNAALGFAHDPAQLTRIVLESLAARYAEVVRRLAHVTGRAIESLRVVGGGSRNDLLNQLTADATGLRVLAGPEEATALGNLLVQARAFGATAPPSFAPRGFSPSTG